ncbi:hypothetical protein E1B28_008473 [Marasmius oreades]|uniref:Uncharacterized protein n=1 Tax=Marasmius oreades TaxID=181124 RepID=A0A9P7RYL5_9AGAR|nr:uncharacterized protein E1B28_008473 [Marasmius oreades]KAG7092097.1 hypothetical protein E1B28_008473 [Marasmius oreades]
MSTNKDPRAINYIKYHFERDDRIQVIFIHDETNGPRQDPDVTSASGQLAAERQANAGRGPSPATFFTPGDSISSNSHTAHFRSAGPFTTTSGTYWTSKSRDVLESPPPTDGDRPFPVGTMWVHDVAPNKDREAVRQVFVRNVTDEWVIIPGDLVESGQRFAHPTLSNRYFCIDAGGRPKWLKSDTLDKKEREQKKAGIRGDVVVIAAVNESKKRKRVAFDVDHEPSGTGRKRARSSTPHIRVINPAPATRRVAARSRSAIVLGDDA